jgi:hypothetical protein
MDKSTFPERTAAMKQAAEQLKACAEVVLAEAQRMEAVQTRFAQRVRRANSNGIKSTTTA